MVHAYVLSNFVSISLFCRPLGGNPKICRFWTLAFCGVANWQQSEKVAHAYTTANLTLSKAIKIVSVLQRFHSEIGRTNSDLQKRDGQTDKQKNSTFLAAPAAGEIRPPPNLAQ